MPRSYSTTFLLELKHADASLLGVQLGRLCVEANLPAVYVAKVLGISRNSIYGWFRGKPMHESKRKIVSAFISLAEQDMANGILPARSMKSARMYLQAMVGSDVKV